MSDPTTKELAVKLGNTNRNIRKTKMFADLSDLELAQVDKLLRRKAVSQIEMARIIQEEWGKYTDLKRETLSKRVQRYYNKEVRVNDGVLEAFAKNNKELYKALNLSQVRLDILGELSTAFLQHKQIMDDEFAKREAGLPVDTKTWNALLKERTALLRLITNTYLDIGLIERKPKQSQLHIHSTTDKEAIDFESKAVEQKELEDNTKEVLQILNDVQYEDVTDQQKLPAPASYE